MNQQVMMRKIMKMKQEMEDAQKEIEQTEFSASAGGVVTVTVLGNKELVNVVISEEIEKDDFEMISDMIVAACNTAYKEIEKVTEEKLGQYNSLLGGFGGLF